jgi:hypothetical protein
MQAPRTGAPIIKTRTFRITDYELTFSAQVGDNGGSNLRRSSRNLSDPSVPAVRPGAHPRAEAAIESARAQGVEWMANFGQ